MGIRQAKSTGIFLEKMGQRAYQDIVAGPGVFWCLKLSLWAPMSTIPQLWSHFISEPQVSITLQAIGLGELGRQPSSDVPQPSSLRNKDTTQAQAGAGAAPAPRLRARVEGRLRALTQPNPWDGGGSLSTPFSGERKDQVPTKYLKN